MKILVIGSGGREHAILWSLRSTASKPLTLYCAPGNAGIAQLANCIPIAVTDVDELADFAASEGIDLTFVGPEAPLALGVVDEFQRRGLTIVGPSKVAAQLESSKAFAKDFMKRNSIPTAHYRTAASPSEALDILNSGEFGGANAPVVVKADGLAAGKGVIVSPDRSTAIDAVGELVSGELIDVHAAQRIVIEEKLNGSEVSLLAFCDGVNYALMPAARDHKRIGVGDTGPNTGGMGAVTDDAILGSTQLEQITREVVEPTLAGAQREGFPFCGILFVGLMLTPAGPRVLEYNVRFGDPETQAIVVRLKTSLGEIFSAMAEARLGEINIEWSQRSSACVILASDGYPSKVRTGEVISGLEVASPGVELFHSGTVRSSTGDWLTAGGRVLGVTSTGETLSDALNNCYQHVDHIRWQGMQYRSDIGKFAAHN
jgi:phosphoribosylamine---glycine ligase